VFWAAGGVRSSDADGEGGKDVSGGGKYTHMTMWARDAGGLRNLFRLSSLASIEGYYSKPRMDRELIAEHAAGIIAATGCPSGEVQTRLRLGQYDEAVKAASAYQDIFGAAAPAHAHAGQVRPPSQQHCAEDPARAAGRVRALCLRDAGRTYLAWTK